MQVLQPRMFLFLKKKKKEKKSGFFKVVRQQWRTEGGSNPPPPEIPKALQNRAKLNPIVNTVKSC